MDYCVELSVSGNLIIDITEIQFFAHVRKKLGNSETGTSKICDINQCISK